MPEKVRMYGQHVIENKNRHIICACGEEFDEPRPAVQWRAHFEEERRKVEEQLAQEIAEDLHLTIPHQWEREAPIWGGGIKMHELGDYHDGPRCVRCD